MRRRMAIAGVGSAFLVGTLAFLFGGSDPPRTPAPGEGEPTQVVTVPEAGPGESLTAASAPAAAPAEASPVNESERQPLPGAPDPRPARSPFVLPIRVVDDLGQPLEAFGVRVTAWSEDQAGRGRGGESTDFGQGERPGGRFDIPLATAGSWFLQVQRDGWFQRVESLPVFEVPHPGDPLEIVLDRPAAVRVSVSSAGLALEQVMVESETVHGGSGVVRTDAQGRAHLPGLPPGPGSVTVSSLFLEESRELRLLPGEEHHLEFDLPQGGHLEILVLDPAGDPAPGAPVMYHPRGNGEPEGFEVDDQGRALVGPVPPGEYQLLAVLGERTAGQEPEHILSAEVTVVAGATTEVRMQPDLAAQIVMSGRISRGETPEADCRVFFLREDVPLLQGIRTATADAQGRYEVALGGPGPYLVYFEPKKNSRGNDPVAPQSVRVPEVHAFTRDFRLPGGGIRGRVVAPEGVALDVHGIWVEREDGELSMRLPFAAGLAPIQGDGFELPLLAVGTYRLDVMGATPGSLGGIVVEADRWTEVELKVHPSAILAGRVLGPDGEPVAGAVVRAHDGAGRMTLFGAATDADGGFSYPVPPGRTSVSARAPGLATGVEPVIELSPAPPHPDGSGPAEPSAVIELHLVPAGMLRVHMLDAEGLPAGATVRLFDEADRELTHLGASENPGADVVLSTTSRELGPLAPGSYELHITPFGGRGTTRRVTMGSEDQELEIRLD